MADTKISALPAVTTLAATDVVVVDAAGTTSQITLANFVPSPGSSAYGKLSATVDGTLFLQRAVAPPASGQAAVGYNGTTTFSLNAYGAATYYFYNGNGAAYAPIACGAISGGVYTLATGTQETGKCGARNSSAVNTNAYASIVNFKTKMTNAPSSITINAAEASALSGTPGANFLTVYGFQFYFNATGNGDAYYIGSYSTVGN